MLKSDCQFPLHLEKKSRAEDFPRVIMLRHNIRIRDTCYGLYNTILLCRRRYNDLFSSSLVDNRSGA